MWPLGQRALYVSCLVYQLLIAMTETASDQGVTNVAGRQPTRTWANTFVLTLVLFAMWLIWSGHYHDMFLMALGLCSCLAVVFLLRRMKIIDEEGVPIQLGIRPFINYMPWLIKEIIRANWDVARRIIHPSLPIRPHMIRVKASQKEDLTRVIFANSITLTPGTVSVNMQKDEILVHTLSSEAAEFDQTGEMDRRGTGLERLP